jgi:molecular chaperone GrpE
MSFSDEAAAEGVTPEPGSGSEVGSEAEPGSVAGADGEDGTGVGNGAGAGAGEGETWSEADSAALGAAAEGDPGDQADQADPADPMSVLARERDEYLVALQRTQADFENYRKRITRLQEEQSSRSTAALIEKLLPALDTLDLAKAHQSEAAADSEDAKALTSARAMLLDLLAKEGLERVDEAEVPFDPSVHDAVARSEAEGETGEVVVEEVLRSGYRWKGKVLRPAMVRVRG